MTDHSPGSDERDDDYRLAPGTPQDAVPPSAAQAAAGAGHSGADDPPPQLSGQPGWAYSPTELATPHVSQQGGRADAGGPGGPGGPGAGQGVPYSPTELATPQVPQPGGQAGAAGSGSGPAQATPGYGYPPFQPAAPTQGYGYPGPQSPAQAVGAVPTAQQYPPPPMAQAAPGPLQQQHPMQPQPMQQQPGQSMPQQPYGQAPYGQAPYDPQQPFPVQDPYSRQPGYEQGYGQPGYQQPGTDPQPGMQPGMAPQVDAQSQWPQMPPLPTEGQPGYAYPGYQQPTPPRSGLSRGAIGGIIAGGVALAVIAVGAIMLTSGGGSNGGGGGGGNSVPTLAAGWSIKGSLSDNQVGTWVTDTYFVRASASGVQAYNLADGSSAWTAHPLSGSAVPCAMSPSISASGIGTIGFGPDSHSCSTLVGVDTHTGKTLWSTALTSGQSEATDTSTFIDGQVGVIVNGNVLGGVDLTTGKVVWGYKARGQYCNAYPYGGAGVILVDDYCADVQPGYTLSALDAATGKQLWQKTESDHVQFSSVLNGSPLIATSDDSGSTVAERFDSSGNESPFPIASKIQLPGRPNSADSGTQLVGSSALLLPTSSGSSDKSGIVAVDPSTGSTLWSYDGTTHGGGVLLSDATQGASATGTNGGKIYAMSLVPGGYNDSNGPTVVSLDPSTGKPTDIAHLPASANSTEYGTGQVYVLPHNEILIASTDLMSSEVVQVFK